MRKAIVAWLLALLMVCCSVAGMAEGFLDTIEWDAEYDVVVIGFGAAGGASAITAADNGAKVLMLEKAPKAEAGGNSKVCKQWICYVTDVEQAKTYMKALRGNYITPTDDFIEAYINEVNKNWDWCVELGAPNPTVRSYTEYPDKPGAGTLGLFTVGDGQDDGSAYALMVDNVEKRADMIDVWYEAPGKHLIQDPATRIVHGVEAEVDGKVVNIRAKNGVILACGGFESNEQMLEDYLVRNNLHSLGNLKYNTGDGILMSIEVGANLWHMGNIAGPWISFMDPDTETIYFNMTQPAYAGIYVGPDGTRFANERLSNKHGKIDYHGSYIMYPVPEFSWAIFDETIMTAGPLIDAFSADNQEELAKGWILKADTLEELAEIAGINPQGLADTVMEYNKMVDYGKDIAFQRPADTMQKIEKGPFYALPLTPALINTQGGPERNVRGEVIDTQGNPIPHLFVAGELGDVWSNGYQASCNIGGGLAFGRISGANAAAVKSDVTQESVMNGKENFAPEVKPEAVYEIGENQYIGEGKGKGMEPIVVRVTMDGDKIANIEVLSHSETENFAERALEGTPAAILAAQSTRVDTISGVTFTCEGIMEAVENALSGR